ncbi:hypothetical protein [Bifidobacterium samirii]|uniref:Uncharacterized protein n=1 Tax=Bifidobacterium samirii TaxID=2306974 RepID=A0A430FUY3_9BIFI|nr:hypothetical protein [Bifidobacterium samirii]RSX57274.1 hypothetical protein D2E24_0867 [Bifidobacterium samirii]
MTVSTIRKEYEPARMEVVRFSACDVVCTSGGDPGDNDVSFCEISPESC